MEIEITSEMISAGASVLWELGGDLSKEALAREVFAAMLALAFLGGTSKDCFFGKYKK